MASPNPRESWMSGVTGTAKINRLTIPGTHDSGTWPGSGYDKCQDVSYLEQLRSGVRFLDIRLRYHTSRRGGVNFAVYHSSHWMGSYFDADSDHSDDPNCTNFVLQDCLQFLRENDRECVIVCIKQEYNPENVDIDTFQNTFRDLVRKNGREGAYFWVAPDVPTLDAVRGRIVLVNRLSTGSWHASYGIDWPEWDKAIQGPVDVEDHYMDLFPAEKWDKVKNHLDKAKLAVDGNDTWYVTFVSDAPGDRSPWYYASQLNPRLRDYLADPANAPRARSRLGTILLDFPPQDVVDKIWQYSQGAYGGP